MLEYMCEDECGIGERWRNREGGGGWVVKEEMVKQ